jgi:enoyl-CoA hydratase/carnithine racemase
VVTAEDPVTTGEALVRDPRVDMVSFTGSTGVGKRIMAMASDIRIASDRAKVAFLFNKVGLAGCDMGACAILPRIIGQGRSSEWRVTMWACESMIIMVAAP